MEPVRLLLKNLEDSIIQIGYVGENNHIQVQIDCAEVFEKYPEAIVSMAVSNPLGQTYPATVENEGDDVLWTVTSSDVSCEGDGKIQLTFINGEEIIKTATGKTRIKNSIVGNGPAPDPIVDFVTRADTVLAEIPDAIGSALEAAKESGEFKGDPGEDGYTPVKGVDYFDGQDGYTPVKGVDYFDGADGQDGEDGQDGAPGTDGISPTVTITDITGGHRVVITDAEGPHSFDVMDGQGGGGSVTVDDELSDSSTNPVQNKVITEEVTSLRNVIAKQSQIQFNTSASRFQRKTGNQSDVNSPSDSTTRIMGIPYISVDSIPNGKVKVKPSSGYKWILYQSDGTSYINGYWHYSWSTSEATVTVSNAATEVIMLIAKEDNGTITTDDFDKVIFTTEVTPNDLASKKDVEKVEEELEENVAEINAALDGSWATVPVAWSSGSIEPSSGADLTTDIRIRTGYISVTGNSGIKAIVESGYKFVIDYFNSSKQPLTYVNDHGTWNTQGKEYSLPNEVAYVRFLLALNNDGTISTSAGSNGTFYLMSDAGYKLLSMETLGKENEYACFNGIGNAFAALKNGGSSDDSKRNLSSMPSFIHISDTHGDNVRFDRAARVAAYLGVDAVLASGDFTKQATDDFAYVVNSATKNNIMILPCVGNHDASGQTDEYVFGKYIEPFEDDIDLPSGVTNPTYFSMDFDSKKIRVISVNQYENQYANSYNGKMLLQQDQTEWFCDTLLSTPAGYGVIVMLHSPEETPVADSTYTKFKQATLRWTDVAIYRPFTEIVDAFISGTTLEKTYNNDTGASPASFSVDTDFSGKNTGVEFIAFVSGHLHSDNITYMSNTTNKQLLLNIVCGTASETSYYNGLSDLGRTEKGVNQDAFNLYVIDRATKKVRVVRIGADMPFTFAERRDYMLIPYAD